MKRSEPQSVGDLMRSLIGQSALNEGILVSKAIDAFPKVVGHHIADSCRRPSIANGVMNVPVESAALRQELSMCRSALVAEINICVGREVISDIRFTMTSSSTKYIGNKSSHSNNSNHF